MGRPCPTGEFCGNAYCMANSPNCRSKIQRSTNHERNHMTTSVTILNHGPDNIHVVPVDNQGNEVKAEAQTVAPNAISHPIYVYPNRNIHIAEEQEYHRTMKAEAAATA